jgi:uncharacterized membrane-anchored protein
MRPGHGDALKSNLVHHPAQRANESSLTNMDPRSRTSSRSAAGSTNGRGVTVRPTGWGRQMAAKVPAITLIFWVTKILTTGMGETTSDYLAHVLDPVVAVGLAGVGLVIALAAQFAARRYVAWIYWAAVVMVSIFGTMAADAVHVVLGVPYVASTVFFSVALAVILAAWYASERTLSIHSIRTPRREAFYWATVLTTFALGTAAGDMTAATMHLGYLVSGAVFAVLIALPLLAWWRFGLNSTVAFWAAYIVTRPLGASFADWSAVLHSRGGLGFGYGPVSLVMAVVILGFVGYLAVSRRDVQSEPAAS